MKEEVPVSKRLRIIGLMVQPVVVWDHEDGDLEPGPELTPSNISLREVDTYLDGLPARIDEITAKILDQEAAEAEAAKPNRAARRTTARKRAPAKKAVAKAAS